MPKPKRAAPPAKTKQDLLKAAQQESEANKQRMMALEKGSFAAPALPTFGGGPTRPVGGYGSDSDSGELWCCRGRRERG